MSNLPLVTIGMPVYNGEHRVRGGVDSILSQDYPNIEFIISDNCSTDKTPEILKEYADKYPNLKVVNQSENVGARNNFRLLPNLATGEYFMWAAHDDRWAPNCISTLVELLEGNQLSDLALSSWKSFVDKDDPLKDENKTRYENLINKETTTVYDNGNVPSSFGYYEMATKMLNVKDTYYICIYGLGRMPYMKHLANNFGDHLDSDRLFGIEVALSTKIATCKDVLMYQYMCPIGTATKFKGDPMLAVRDKSRFLYPLYIFWNFLKRLTRSQVIPLSRKIYIPSLMLKLFFNFTFPAALPHLSEEVKSFKTRGVRWVKRKVSKKSRTYE